MSASRDAEKEAFWRMVVQEQQKSDLSIRDFCRTEGLTESLFYAWRRELRHRDQEGKDVLLMIFWLMQKTTKRLPAPPHFISSEFLKICLPPQIRNLLR